MSTDILLLRFNLKSFSQSASTTSSAKSASSSSSIAAFEPSNGTKYLEPGSSASVESNGSSDSRSKLPFIGNEEAHWCSAKSQRDEHAEERHAAEVSVEHVRSNKSIFPDVQKQLDV